MFAQKTIALLALSGGGNGGLLDVNPGLIIWTLVIFVILLLILSKTAWKPMLSALGERENFIKGSLDKAELAKNEAQKILEENRANLDKADEDARKIVEEGREYAEKLKQQILDESKQEAKKMIEAASSEIERKNQEAFNQLKGQIADISISVAEKILRDSLDKEKQTVLVNKFIEDLNKN